ncbi:MAG: hypothetical protein A2428_14655 [Bdellovibrionales bacterium RIFOXYC1_FULL_54_43]|nr:MAG: hypothetical protein A2428_14655 [Bdellovibrionales bacterium RIFOXYC1_FULL_54_43]OFZ82518.1 MAG: hypothetical protein A2603_15470 [Bdellovibrionales bacterium RIFOXYD1_FULL_55_31]
MRTVAFYLCTLWILLSGVSDSVRAFISVDPGEYEIPALVYSSSGELFAVVNKFNRSKLKIKLSGDRAKAAAAQLHGMSGRMIRIRVPKMIVGSLGEAELLRISPLQNAKPIPLRVGNNFEPIR